MARDDAPNGDDAPNEPSDTATRDDGRADSDDSEGAPEKIGRSVTGSGVDSTRRTYLQLVGGGITLVGGVSSRDGVGFGERDTEAVDVGGPPDQANMALALEDRFESTEIDASSWEVGWGWGKTTRNSPTRVTSENVELRDGKLHLEGSHEDGEILSGGVNTRNRVTVGPGSYFEARIKFPDRQGFLPAFWAKPNDETWPPEIDVVELFQNKRGEENTHQSHHYLHYSKSTTPGDRSTYEGTGQSYTPGDDLTENFHVYGVEWETDKLVHYVDGEEAMVTTDPNILRAMENGAPFYLLCSLEIDKIGTADKSEPWGESMAIDWVRVWE